jgi:RNA polymerase sigma-70 factor (ECF subfamily)
LRSLKRGDKRSFEALVRRHGTAIKAYALRMLRSLELAEDVYVDTFERVARARGPWREGGSVRAYLFTIAHNCCMDHLRKRQRATEQAPQVVTLERNRRIEPSPEAVTALGQLAEDLEEALQVLPEQHRRVLLLRLVHGLTSAETAQVVGLDAGQVRSQLSYARKQLQAVLAERASVQDHRGSLRKEKGTA